jgi:protoporphyrin/coproporphyrin ferrochelatase
MSSEMSAKSETAVLMMGYGGPNSFEEVRPFILNITRGRNVPPERIEAVVEQYRLIGGKSPFNELTTKQADALQAKLDAKSLNISVYQGMLFWTPYIADTVSAMHRQGVRRVIGLIMAPYRTEASFDRYVSTLRKAIADLGAENGNSISVEFVNQWNTHPLFIQAAAQQVVTLLQKLKKPQYGKTKLLFCAHSIPQSMDEESGYAKQIEETSALVVQSLKNTTGHQFEWTLAYQSRSGSPREKWLEPDVQSAIKQAKTDGWDQIVAIPIGFVCDHVEVLYDLDVLAAGAAKEAGIEMLRASTVGDHGDFVELLAELVKETADSFYAKPERN